MRWNDFTHDAIAMQDCTHAPSASNAISERADLTALNAGCIGDIARSDEGGIDLKYTSTAWFAAPAAAAEAAAAAAEAPTAAGWKVRAQSGPTYDIQPPFVWSTSPFADHSHVGQPDTWRFPYVNFSFPWS